MNSTVIWHKIVTDVATRFRELTGFTIHMTAPPGDTEIKGILIITSLGGATREFAVEPKRLLTAQNLHLVTKNVMKASTETNLPPLIITDYVNPNIAKHLREAGINYIDTAGNAYLTGPSMVVDIQGQRPPQALDMNMAIGAKGLQLIAYILMHPHTIGSAGIEIDETYREIAQNAGVALGTIKSTFEQLQTRGILQRIGTSRQLLFHDADELLELWTQGYTDILRPKLLMSRYRLAPDIEMKNLGIELFKSGVRNILVGGEAAAAAFTNHLRPERVTLHIFGDHVKLPPHLFAPDQRGNVDVLQGFTDNAETWGRYFSGYINPVIVYAEILASAGTDSRIIETAEKLKVCFEHDITTAGFGNIG